MTASLVFSGWNILPTRLTARVCIFTFIFIDIFTFLPQYLWELFSYFLGLRELFSQPLVFLALHLLPDVATSITTTLCPCFSTTIMSGWLEMTSLYLEVPKASFLLLNSLRLLDLG